MKTKFLILALSLLAATAITAEVEYEDGVAVLTDDNFQQVLDDNEYVFVKFFAPWCGHCKQMKPHFIAAADLYFGDEAETPVVFGDLDATVHGETARQFGVNSYPTLKLFVNGEAIDFKGGRDEDGMIEWMEQKLEQQTQTVESLSQLEEAMEDNKVLVLFYGEQGTSQLNMFNTLAKNFDNLPMFATDSEEIAQEFSLEENSLVLLKQFDERRNDYDGEFNVADMKAFVDAHRFASVMEFNDDAADRIFQIEKKKTIFLFMEENEEGQRARAALQEAARKLKKGVLFAWADIENEASERLRDFLGIQAEMVPTIRLFVPDGYKKYKMEPEFEAQEITKKSIMTFYNRYRRRKIKPYLKSEPVPTEQEAVVKVVGDNFQDVVMNKQHDVLVKYYAPWCGHCKQLAPIWDELAETLSGVDNLVIAKMDSTANEVDGVNVQSYPTLIFYPANNKGKPVTHEGARKHDDLLEWLQDKTSNKVNWDQFDMPVEDDSEEEGQRDEL